MSEATAITLIVGLGNPGAEYADTRHNAGFAVIEELLRMLPGSFAESRICESRCWSGRFRGRALHLQQPLTYMNLSGRAIAGLARKLKLTPPEILVIQDDLDLPPGRLRIRRGGGAGGHHGVESAIAELGSSDFYRLRLGIGRAEGRGETVEHVLTRVPAAEQSQWDRMIKLAAAAALEILSCGASRAMTRYNRAEESAAEQEVNGQEKPREA